METTELIKIIGCGEDSRTQFKREPIGARKLAEEMVAFSNSGGEPSCLAWTMMGRCRG